VKKRKENGIPHELGGIKFHEVTVGGNRQNLMDNDVTELRATHIVTEIYCSYQTFRIRKLKGNFHDLTG
jgi:hypothetical protein